MLAMGKNSNNGGRSSCEGLKLQPSGRAIPPSAVGTNPTLVSYIAVLLQEVGCFKKHVPPNGKFPMVGIAFTFDSAPLNTLVCFLNKLPTGTGFTKRLAPQNAAQRFYISLPTQEQPQSRQLQLGQLCAMWMHPRASSDGQEKIWS